MGRIIRTLGLVGILGMSTILGGGCISRPVRTIEPTYSRMINMNLINPHLMGGKVVAGLSEDYEKPDLEMLDKLEREYFLANLREEDYQDIPEKWFLKHKGKTWLVERIQRGNYIEENHYGILIMRKRKSGEGSVPRISASIRESKKVGDCLGVRYKDKTDSVIFSNILIEALKKEGRSLFVD